MKSQPTFNELKTTLSDEDIGQILMIITYKCRIKTYQRIKSILTYSASLIPYYGILDRLIKEDGKWEYITGQSHTDEMRIVRNCILGKV